MILTRIFTIQLMTFLLSGETFAQLPISISDIRIAIDVGVKIYNINEGYENPDKTKENVEKILKDVNELTTQLERFETKIDVKLDDMLDVILNKIQIQIDMQNPKAKFIYYLRTVDAYYDNTMKYKIGSSYSNETIINSGQEILWGRESLPHMLNDIYNLFISQSNDDISPGFLSLYHKSIMQNHTNNCNKFLSAQQRIYYIYSHVILAEMKGLAIIKKVYTEKWYFSNNHDYYVAELNDAKKGYVTRMTQYHKIFSDEMSRLSRHIHTCDLELPLRNINCIEMQFFSRIKLFNYRERGTGCFSCPKDNDSDLSIYNCKETNWKVKACKAAGDSSRQYLYWQYTDNSYAGHYSKCSHEIDVDGGVYNPPMSYMNSGPNPYYYCKICECSVDEVKNSHEITGRISITEQISDIWSNMVVIGIRFIHHERGVHLQIRQARFSVGGMASNSTNWKELGVQYHNQTTTINATLNYVNLRRSRKTLYLDDIIVPYLYAVTGLRFVVVDDTAFALELHATPFNLQNGKLNPSGSKWYGASTNSIKTEDYKRERIEIDMGKADDPTKITQFHYDPHSNKKIKFIHTDVTKDAGQTTIPLFDAQHVDTSPSFPLDGVGLYFRGKSGFSGYIAPRIYTIDLSQYMREDKKSTKTVCNSISNTHKNCMKQVPDTIPVVQMNNKVHTYRRRYSSK